MNGEIRLFKILVSSRAELYCGAQALIKFINIRAIAMIVKRSYRSISVVSLLANLSLREMGKLTKSGPWPLSPVSRDLSRQIRDQSSCHVISVDQSQPVSAPGDSLVTITLVTPTRHILQMSITGGEKFLTARGEASVKNAAVMGS